jgi:hypothetical protein
MKKTLSAFTQKPSLPARLFDLLFLESIYGDGDLLKLNGDTSLHLATEIIEATPVEALDTTIAQVIKDAWPFIAMQTYPGQQPVRIPALIDLLVKGATKYAVNSRQPLQVAQQTLIRGVKDHIDQKMSK